MNRKLKQVINRKYKTILLLSLIIFIFANSFTVIITLIKTTNSIDIISDLDTNTYLTLSMASEATPQPPPSSKTPTYKMEPVINWYDLQTTDGKSVLNSKINVNQEYKFCINILSNQGWEYIEYINITAWYDNGDDSTIYNQSEGGNINMFLQYQNISGNANYGMLWPKDEVTLGNFTEKEEKIKNPDTQNSQCYNLTFSFTPGYQFRYAPGEGIWDATKNTFNDIRSWNFEIAVSGNSDGTSESKTSSVFDEFGVNSYSEMVSIGLPSIHGLPGENASGLSNLSIKTRSNIDYALSVDLDTFLHEDNPSIKLLKNTMWITGGDLIDFMNFNDNISIYLYGSSTIFKKADDYNTMKITNNVDYKCDIPLGQIPGNYYSTVTYKIDINNL